MARTYSSTVRSERAAANRRLVVETATRLFCDVGWVATTMAGVAEAAGLTRQTVYQQFVGKLALLDACIDHALSEGTGVPVRDLSDYRAMGEGAVAERLTAGAHWLRGAHERSARIQNVLDQAAVTDESAAQRLRERETTRWNEVAHAATLILGTAPTDDVVDSLWLLTSRRVWLMFLDGRGWSPDQWMSWFVTQSGTTLGVAGS